VIAFRCMTGRLPFEGEAVGDVLVKLCTAPLPVPSTYVPDLPPGFDAWLTRALGREPEARFQSASELGRSLAAVCGLSAPVTPFSGEQFSAGSHGSGQHRPAAFSATTPSPALTPAPAAQTGAPITQTPAPSAKTPASTLVVVAAAALAVLAIGAGVAVKGFGKSEVPVASGVPELTTVNVPQVPPSATTAPHAVAPTPPASAAQPAAPPSAAPETAPTVTAAPPMPVNVRPVVRGPKTRTPPVGPSPTQPKPVSDIGF
jgi:serine/threonine protein kinase